MTCRGLMQRLNDGEKVIVAEGYIFNFEKRCYVQAGPFVPTVVLEHPDLVKQSHEEFVRAGSDVVQAFTASSYRYLITLFNKKKQYIWALGTLYYGHREKLKLIDRSADLETLNRTALRIARECATDTGTLMAGDICNTNTYNPANPSNREKLEAIFKEQVEWAIEEGADFIVAETFGILDEALIALDVIKRYGKGNFHAFKYKPELPFYDFLLKENDNVSWMFLLTGVPAVTTIAVHNNLKDGVECTVDEVEVTEAMKRIESAGADVVGLNCARGPDTMLPLMEKIKKSGVKAHLAALPVTYRTTEKEPSFMNLTDPKTGKLAFPINLDCALCPRDDIFEFGRRCDELGINYVGLCCGNSPHYTRTLAESFGRKPPGSKFSPEMSLHCIFGTDEKVDKYLTTDAVENVLGRKNQSED
ncbi:Betaine--homocysteine S-methyltransferase 1 [Holothuria leucospilota]|uniref:Betaine--homocysteine S-methyltransferase 1 n=1 Tax=Holothuria leucospilota TaxID=206669 RepID=A0A9Q1BGS3_HOLLE|nr:Betaine--homocysteine S-methyltransferase 1 [Holothuria leucospilota]